MEREATKIKVYYDTQVAGDPSWAYCIGDEEGDFDTGSLDSTNLDEAVEEIVGYVDMDLDEDDFVKVPEVDGGYAEWISDVRITQSQRDELLAAIEAADLVCPVEVADHVINQAEQYGMEAGREELDRAIANDAAEERAVGIESDE